MGHRNRETVRPVSLISSPTRRSLSVHRPYRLPRSATRNPEPSAPLIARQGAPAGSRFRAREEDLELLRAIAASKVFTEYEHAFTKATGLPVALEPVESLHLSLHDRRSQGPFCALMAGQNRTCGACLQSQSEVAEAGLEGPHTGVCYAGLSEAVVPLRVGRRLIGFLWTGKVFLRKPTKRQFERILDLLRSWGSHFNEEQLRGAYFGTRQLSPERLAAAVKLLTIFAGHLAMLGNQIMIQRDNAEPPMVTKAKDFIRENFTEALSLPQVARVANASPFHFCKMFKRATGLSFTNFVSRVRIESSKTLLANPQLRVSEVAFEAGFQSLTHFNRVFHKLLGESPTEYRLKLQTKAIVT